MTAGYDSYEAFDENGETLRCCEAIGHYLAALKPLEQNILETRKTVGKPTKPYVTLCQVLSNHKCSKVAMSAEEIRRNPFVPLED